MPLAAGRPGLHPSNGRSRPPSSPDAVGERTPPPGKRTDRLLARVKNNYPPPKTSPENPNEPPARPKRVPACGPVARGREGMRQPQDFGFAIFDFGLGRLPCPE